jgi:hypothetical protein
VTDGSKRNLIGGEAKRGNDATNGVFVQPAEVNQILGNDVNGVLLTNHAHRNHLTGNLIGADATEGAALDNGFEGVSWCSVSSAAPAHKQKD